MSTLTATTLEAAVIGDGIGSRLGLAPLGEAAGAHGALGPSVRCCPLGTGATARAGATLAIDYALGAGAVARASAIPMVARRQRTLEQARAGAGVGGRVVRHAVLGTGARGGSGLEGVVQTPALGSRLRAGAWFAVTVARRGVTVETPHVGAGLGPVPVRGVTADGAVAAAGYGCRIARRALTMAAARAGAGVGAVVARRAPVGSGARAGAGARPQVARLAVCVARGWVGCLLPPAPGGWGFSAEVRGWAMSEYRDCPVRELGARYAVGPGGLYVSGVEAVPWHFATGLLDLGGADLVRVPRARVEIGTLGRVTLATTTTQERRTRRTDTYMLRGQDPGLQVREVDLGRGVRGRRWQFTVAGPDGQEAVVARIRIEPQGLGR